jgi:hypothetical protein
MSSWTWTRAPAALAAAAVAVLLIGGPALALPPPPIPADVQAAFAGEALRQAQAGGEGVDADFSGAQVEAVHEIFRFSPDFVDGKPTTEPLVPAGQWLGSLTRGDDVLGTLGVWRNGNGPPQPNGYSNDVLIGRALRTLTPTELLVVDEPTGTYYAVDGTTARPLNDWAREALPEPADLAQLQGAVAARYAELRAQPAEEGPVVPGLTISLVGMALALLVGGGLLLLLQGRRRPAGSA